MNRALAAGGLAAVGVGLLGLFELGAGVAAAFAVVTLLLTAWLASSVVVDGRDERTLPSVERAAGTEPPGASIADALGQFVGGGRVGRSARDLRGALSAAAVSALVRAGDRSRDEAESAVAAGTWTDDARAAAFLADGDEDDASWRDRLPFGGGSTLRDDVRATVDAVASVAGVERAGDAPVWFAVRPGTPVETVPSLPPDHDGGLYVRERRSTGRWRGLRALGLATLAVGTLLRSPSVVLLGALPFGYLGAAALGASRLGADAGRDAPDIAVERTLADEGVAPGDRVAVELTVTNEGASTVADCRLVDGVPVGLPVVDGSARAAVTLAPGESTTLRYAVAARRGSHAFGPTLAVVRDGTAARAVECLCPAASTLRVLPRFRASGTVPLRRQATRAAGEIRTGDGGEGTTFHATREYRKGDPLSRVDWRRWARTGEFATVEFERERAATVVFVVDARAASYVAPDPESEHALDRALGAVASLYPSLTDAGNRVGLTAVSTADCWVPPGAGAGHRARFRETLGTHPALSSAPEGTNLAARQAIARLDRRLPSGAQVLLLSPLCDDYAAAIARRFEVGGHPATVVSPDPTTTDSPSQTLARVARENRVHDLREAGVTVVDWAWDEPLSAALERGERR
ncbi:DUF58 domain-containing protein [Haloarchaeobius iranensis]|uniref:Uncharacterized conserved protein, DUF58 family, contains vWF domain n=1 Tax=Haloarchaeobius iranensis TaxID=996166 RepID=A0A1G9Y8C8_9EURY|nr:DUF58 domain-containing protein [Haloarchaeobius iranensis]SDN04785.1 Uncharacterized conserved protein, DUF58 family, contains vWF domain [Haloarchaeobius iranensis]